MGNFINGGKMPDNQKPLTMTAEREAEIFRCTYLTPYNMWEVKNELDAVRDKLYASEVARENLQTELADHAETLEQLVPVSRWCPIETAPKDGSGVLLYAMGIDGKPMRVIARWGCAIHCFSSAKICPKPACDFRWLGELGTKYGVVFTHWQPLPQPPADAASQPSSPEANTKS